MSQKLLISFASIALLAAAESAPEASPTTPTSQLGQGIRIQAGSALIDTDHAAPYVFDFDGDGIRDLLVGEFGNTQFADSRLAPHIVTKWGPNSFAAGKLRIYKNHGTNTEPRFRDFMYLKTRQGDASVPITCCISFCPHFVDYDGDGDIDILSGCYTGEIYLFVRDKDGRFQQGVPILDDHGAPLQTGTSVTVEAHDLDGDGDLDLLIGHRGGSVTIHENLGTRTAPSYAAKGKGMETRGGKSIYGSNAHYADWDNDGIRDLVLGSEDGNVTWYKNVGADNKPIFDEAQMLINIKQYGFEKIPRENAPTHPGSRTKVHVTDWNGDGRVDLLVGDVRWLYYTLNPLTASEQKEHDALEPKRKQAIDNYIALLNERGSYLRKNQTVPEEIQKRYEEATALHMTLSEQMRFYNREKTETHGYVWVYLRDGKATDPTAPKQAAKENAAQVSLQADAKPGKNDNTYEVTLRLRIEAGWHIYAEDSAGEYSLTTPKLELPEGFEQVGTFKAEGTRQPATNGSDAVWYADEVSFTAKLRHKPNAKGPIKAIVSFQACDDKICMPANQLSASIDLLAHTPAARE